MAEIMTENSKDENSYENRVGPGVIFAMSNSRHDNLPWSDIVWAVYQQFGSGDLQYVFRLNVINEITKPLVRDQIYPANGLKWPDETLRDWLPGSDEYAALIGTPNGKGVAALLLSNYRQLGARKIAKITTWAGGKEEHLQILYTID